MLTTKMRTVGALLGAGMLAATLVPGPAQAGAVRATATCSPAWNRDAPAGLRRSGYGTIVNDLYGFDYVIDRTTGELDPASVKRWRVGGGWTLLLGIDKDTRTAYLYAVGHANGTATVIKGLGQAASTFAALLRQDLLPLLRRRLRSPNAVRRITTGGLCCAGRARAASSKVGEVIGSDHHPEAVPAVRSGVHPSNLDPSPLVCGG